MLTDAPTIDRHRTALVRTDLSRPVRLALEHGLLPSGATAFAYGCGHGGDVTRLQERGVPVGCWDPYYAADQPLAESDLVNLGYVLNVIEDTIERAEALRRAWSLARRVLVAAAQLLVDQPDATEVPFGDGFLTRLNTFQRYFDLAELGAYIYEPLGVEPLAARLGAYYIFRHEEDGHAFRARQFRRSTRPAMVRLPKIEVHLTGRDAVVGAQSGAVGLDAADGGADFHGARYGGMLHRAVDEWIRGGGTATSVNS